MAKLQLTTEEVNIIQTKLHNLDFPELITYIKEQSENFIPTIMGLPTIETLEEVGDEGIEFLDKWRNPYIAYYIEGEDKPFSIFDSLGEDAGSDDDPIAEFENYEELQTWYNKLIETGHI